MTRISVAKIICIHDKLLKSQSAHKATHFRGQLFQLLDIFRFFDLLFGGSLTALILFSYSRNAAFFTNVSLAESVSRMWFKDRPRFLYIITLHLSEIANYFVIITERLYLIQRRSTDTKWTRLLSWIHLIDVHQNLVFEMGKNRWRRVWLTNHVVLWNAPREGIFFWVASWLFLATWCSFTVCLSSSESLPGVLRLKKNTPNLSKWYFIFSW